jgi:hypothetical protein
MVFTGTDIQYTSAVVTGTLSGGVLTVNYTDPSSIPRSVQIIGTVTDLAGNQYNFRTRDLAIN